MNDKAEIHTKKGLNALYHYAESMDHPEQDSDLKLSGAVTQFRIAAETLEGER